MSKKKQSEELYPGGELPRVKNSANNHLFPRRKEENKLPSLTVPNQSMSVLEMVKRYKAGLPIDGNTRVPVWNGDDALPNIADLDLAEQQEIIEAVADRLADLKLKIEQENQDKKKKEELARIDEIVKEKLKQIQAINQVEPPPAGGGSQ